MPGWLERVSGAGTGQWAATAGTPRCRRRPMICPVGRSRPRGAAGFGRTRGKQKGAPGHSLAGWATPDEYVAHRPDGDCGCGADLAGAADVGVERSHQVHDLPEIEIRVRQHDLYRVRCGVRPRACRRVARRRCPGRVASYGPNIRSLVVYLLIYQHVPVERCVELIADLTGGTAPSTGFCHGLLARCATAVRESVTRIKSLIILAHVVGFDETTLRAGPAGQKRYVLSAVTDQYSLFHLGGRDLASFRAFGILPGFTGIAVHDRYRNYFHHGLETPGRTPDLRFPPAAGLHRRRRVPTPTRSGPSRPLRALRGLIHAGNLARDAGPAAIASAVRDPLIALFRHAVRVGLSKVRPSPGPRSRTAQPPGRALLEFCRDREADVLRFCFDTRSGPPTTSVSATCARPRPSRRSPGGSPARSHPGPAGHPQLHRHHPQTRRRCHGRNPRSARRRPLAPTATGTGLTGPPRKFRTSVMGLSYAANCSFRNSLWTSLGVR